MHVMSVSDNRSYKLIRCCLNDVPHHDYNARVLPEEKDLVIMTVEGCAAFGLVEKVDTERVVTRVSSSSDHNGR